MFLMANSNEYMREYLRTRYHERRQLAYSLLGGRCERCGATSNLEFDHIDPSSKTMSFSRMALVSMANFLEELSKGRLLCDPCHNLKTLSDKGQVPARGTHGTLAAYRYCRCELCRKAKRDWSRTYIQPNRRKKSALVPESG